MYRSEDIAPLLTSPPPPDGNMRFGKGQVLAWNPATGANTIRYRGADLTNVPIADSSDLVLIKPGDNVGLVIAGGGGFSTVYVIGRITGVGDPGTGAAAAFVEDLIDRRTDAATVTASESTSSVNTFVDLATVGPAVTITVRSTGRVLVDLSALMTSGPYASCMGFAVSGATTRAASIQESVAAGVVSPATALNYFRVGRRLLVSGLSAGPTTFTAKYCSVTTGGSGTFADRHIVVTAL